VGIRESQFFQAASSGGTLASSAFRLALEVMQCAHDPSRYNVYFSTLPTARTPPRTGGRRFAPRRSHRQINYAGYVETGGGGAYDRAKDGSSRRSSAR